MEQRIKSLESGFSSLDKTVSVMSEQLKGLAAKDDLHQLRLDMMNRFSKLDADIASISGKLDSKANAVDVAELKGRVGRIPTAPVMVAILVLFSLLYAALRHFAPSLAGVF